jgi:hypothetical protein
MKFFRATEVLKAPVWRFRAQSGSTGGGGTRLDVMIAEHDILEEAERPKLPGEGGQAKQTSSETTTH